MVFPSMNTTRLEHSLGVLHVAGLLMENALAAAAPKTTKAYLRELFDVIPAPHRPSRSTELQPALTRAARWYGLLHDIGHLPYSHLVEHCIEDTLPAQADDKARVTVLYPGTTFKKIHEAAGEYIAKNDPAIRNALAQDPPAAWLVERLLSSEKADPPILQPFKDILTADVDADRIDSTIRDGLFSGGDIGRYDIGRLEQSTVLHKHNGHWKVFFTTRAVNAVESLLVERFKTYRWLHYHPKVVAFKNAFRHCFRNLGIEPGDWHASHYVHANGYLDDAFVKRLIAEKAASPPHKTHVGRARQAILFRTNDARSLWKRRDDYRALSLRFANQLPDPPAEEELKALYLNGYKSARTSIEASMNAGLPQELRDQLRIVVTALDFKAFDNSRWGTNIGEFHILKHSDPAASPLRLTTESRLVRNLLDAASAEPGLGVTVIGDPEKQHQALLEKLLLDALTPIKPPATQ
ncbi:MAG: HD domain-containing protein [Acidobacteria bacterium]|nr:MAG: HD domain-containing protein [Acidobacteriota bacterium]